MSGLFGGKPSTPKPTRMPDDKDPAAIEARRRQLAAQQATSGRASTDLTSEGRSTAQVPGVSSGVGSGATPGNNAFTGSLLGS